MSINVHPGKAIQEFMEDYGLSQSKLAQELRVPVRRINTIVCGLPASSTTAPVSGLASRRFSTSTKPSRSWRTN